MGMAFHQLLRSLCSDTDWKYAVLWKLKHRGRRVLTLQDAYYENSTAVQSHGQNFSNDLLGSAVGKMSNRVYSLVEGIVGQVAVTGKYRWIFADDQDRNSSLFFENCHGSESPLFVGVKTVVVVSVAPIGVIQLGSLNRVVENTDLVSYIKNIFLCLQDYLIDHFPNPMQFSMKSYLSVEAIPTKHLALESVSDLLHTMKKDVKKETSGHFSPFPCLKENQAPSRIHREAVEAHETYSKLYHNQYSNLLQSTLDIMHLEHQKFVDFHLLNEKKLSSADIGLNETRIESENNSSFSLDNIVTDNSDKHELISRPDKVVFYSTCSPQDNNCVNCNPERVDLNPEGPLTGAGSWNTTKLEPETEACHWAISCTSLNIPADCELQEALAPASLHFNYEGKETQNVELSEIADGGSSTSKLTSESLVEHLLEDTVANVYHNNSGEVSFSTSVQSQLTSAMNQDVIINLRKITSESCSLDDHSLTKDYQQPYVSSLGIGDLSSQKRFSLSCTSSEQFDWTKQPEKNRKKCSRPDEKSCRRRPRDRKLIQDRIKELRKLVPNGAKCSIASLLEQTIKEMLFLQSIADPADKSDQSAGSKRKLQIRKPKFLRSKSSEQGRSWAMEVGGHLKVHSILVENLEKNGQIYVEMLCEEDSQFLEIARAIQKLGLKILESATRAHGEKNLICFVVEGQSNQRIHRLDVLWPLVQILQSKSAMQQSL